jgi:hypothetical protein
MSQNDISIYYLLNILKFSSKCSSFGFIILILVILKLFISFKIVIPTKYYIPLLVIFIFLVKSSSLTPFIFLSP